MKNDYRVLVGSKRDGVFVPMTKEQLYRLIVKLLPEYKLKRYCLRKSDRYFLHAVVLRSWVGLSSRFIFPDSVESLFK